MAGRLVEQVNRLIRSGVANITGEVVDPAARNAKALVVVRHQLGKLIVDRRNLARELAELPPEAKALSEKAEMAVRKGREDLARAAMTEIARMTSGREAIAGEIAGLDADIAMLELAVAQLTGEKPSVGPSEQASLRALLAELESLEQQPEQQSAKPGRRGRET